MPYVRSGKCVYKKTSKGLVKKGCSPSVAGAKKYLKKLYMVEKEKKK
jgi:hypothetical protein